MGFAGCRADARGGGVERSGEAWRKYPVGFKRPCADDWEDWVGSTGGRPLCGRAGAGCELRAAVRCGDLLEGRGGGRALKPSASAGERQGGQLGRGMWGAGRAWWID